MTLKDWLDNGWLKAHQSSSNEVSNQLRKIDRDLNNARIPAIDSDWKLNIAFNAARLCADLALRVSGYRVKVAAGAHEKTLDSLRYTLHEDSEVVALLRALLNKRGAATYDGSAIVQKKRRLRQSISQKNSLTSSSSGWRRSIQT